MFNIFFEPNYALRKKNLFSSSLLDSQILNYYIKLFFTFNLAVSKNLIINGPLMRMNNSIILSKKEKRISLNKIKHKFSVILQFDNFGEEVLKKILIKNDGETKVLVGPFYTLDQLKNLQEYVKRYPFVKILISSRESFESIISEFDLNIDPDQCFELPGGVLEEKLLYNGNQENRKNKCLIYFKNRSYDELDLVKTFLKTKNIPYEIFEYGKFKNKSLINQAKICQFATVLTTTESQGYGVQELMSQNIPLLVWDKSENIFENKIVRGTSVPFWDNVCGIKVNSFDELEKEFIIFYKNIATYHPAEYFKDNLTIENELKTIKKYFKI
jgi:hypothetical protein